MGKLKLPCGPYVVAIDSKSDYDRRPTSNLYSYDADYWEGRGYISDSVYDIVISLADQVLKRVVIGAGGGSTTVHDTSYILESDRFVICCGDTVFCLSIPGLSLLWKTKADSATCFEIYKYQADYIVHGELEVSRISHKGELAWTQSGADIFTTIHSDKDDFLIADNYILATDWNNKQYKFDFDGNPIN